MVLWVLMLVIAGVLVRPPLSRCEPFDVTVGVKIWVPRWDIRVGGDKLTSDLEAVAVPAIDLRWEKFFVGGQLAAGRFHFEGGTKGESDFIQVDTAIGYYVEPWFAPYMGYLFQRQAYAFENVQGEQTLGLGSLGLLFNRFLFGRQEALYINAALVGLGLGGTFGGMIETGVAYVSGKFPLALSLAIKYQDFHYDSNDLVIDGQTRSRDTMIGLNGAVYYTLN